MNVQLTPREYLETALKSVSGQGSAVEAKNKVHSDTTTHILRLSMCADFECLNPC